MENQRWAVVDCGKYPSDSNCQLKMMVPEDRKEDLVEASAQHMVYHHHEADNQETRQMVRGAIEIQQL